MSSRAQWLVWELAGWLFLVLALVAWAQDGSEAFPGRFGVALGFMAWSDIAQLRDRTKP